MVRLIVMLLVLAGPTMVQAQQWGRWFHGPGEFRDYSAYVSELENGDLMTMEVVCAADRAYLGVTFSTVIEAEQSAQARVRVDANAQRIPARYLDIAGAGAWWMPLGATLAARLVEGDRVRVRIAGHDGRFRLNGSRDAIRAALRGCGSGRGYQPDWFQLQEAGIGRRAGADAAGVGDGGASGGTGESGDGTRTGGGSGAGTGGTGAGTGGMVRFSDLIGKAREACQSEPQIDGTAVMRADFDQDGTRDILFLWDRVRCPNTSAVSSVGAGFCGMQNCSVDVYLSSTYQPGGWPQAILSHMEVPLEIFDIGGRPALRTHYAGGDCAFAEICDRVWQFDGAKLSPVN